MLCRCFWGALEVSWGVLGCSAALLGCSWDGFEVPLEYSWGALWVVLLVILDAFGVVVGMFLGSWGGFGLLYEARGWMG